MLLVSQIAARVESLRSRSVERDRRQLEHSQPRDTQSI